MGLLALPYATAFAVLPAPESGIVWNANFGRAEIWNDANAEVSTYRVGVVRAGERDIFEFETAPPHRLLRWERSDGGRLTLLDSRRFRYSEKNRPGDESLLPPVPAR